MLTVNTHRTLDLRTQAPRLTCLVAGNTHDIYVHVCFKVKFDAVQMIIFSLDEFTKILNFVFIQSVKEK